MFLEKLKDGYGLVLYPEGTRTRDGRIAEIKPGFGLLARKANVPIIPSVIDGAYECWPKQKKLFSSGQIYVTYGQPIPAKKVAELGDREFAKYLTKILRDMQNAGVKNFEMEAATLLTMAGIFGKRAGAVCVIIANRVTDEFKMSEEFEKRAGLVASRAVVILAGWDKKKKAKRKKFLYPGCL